MLKHATLILVISLLVPFTIWGCSSDIKPDGVRKTARKINKEPPVSAKNYVVEPSVQLEFDEYGIIFAFSNTAGKNILAISDTLPDPNLYTHTISEDGKLIPVTFVEKKTGIPDKEFQQVYSNFSNCGGYLFKTGESKTDYKRNIY